MREWDGGMDGGAGSEELAAYYAGLLEEQAVSGQSVTDFAEEAGVSAGTLYSWRRRLRSQSEGARLLEVDLVEVPVETREERLALQVGRFRIEVPSDFDEGALARLVRSLERC